LQWNGAYAVIDGDEFLYSAYINALLDRRPRRNDPFGGRDDNPNAPLPESTFSIQVLPPFAIASVARISGITASSAFIVLIATAAFLAGSAVFWFFVSVGIERRTAAVGTLFVLCFGAAAAGEGVLRLLLRGNIEVMGLPFLRRYQPSASFFLFFVFCSAIWRSLTADSKRNSRTYAVCAGLIFALMLFSYLYLWTAAITWLVCFGFLWLVTNPIDRRKTLLAMIFFCLVVLPFFPPYLYLLLNRAKSLDEAQTMISTRQLDLFRTPELIGAAVLIIIIVAIVRRKVRSRQYVVLTASLALLPFVLFNQQVITGKSMQPFHFEYFIANYAVLAAVVLVLNFIREPSARIVLWIAALSLLLGLVEMNLSVTGRANLNIANDQIVPVLRRLRELTAEDGTFSRLNMEGKTGSIVFSPHLEVMSLLPTWTAQGVLAGVGPLDFGSATHKDPRVFTYLYYCGATGDDVRRLLKAEADDVFMSNYARTAVFGHERIVPTLTLHPLPISEAEVEREVRNYEVYVAAFAREELMRLPIRYVIARAESGFDFSRIDLWYQRDAGETVGAYNLYRLTLRPELMMRRPFIHRHRRPITNL